MSSSLHRQQQWRQGNSPTAMQNLNDLRIRRRSLQQTVAPRMSSLSLYSCSPATDPFSRILSSSPASVSSYSLLTGDKKRRNVGWQQIRRPSLLRLQQRSDSSLFLCPPATPVPDREQQRRSSVFSGGVRQRKPGAEHPLISEAAMACP